MDKFEKSKEEILCLPTDQVAKLLKDGISMSEVVTQLGESAWQRHMMMVGAKGAI